jgi:arabinan endo-1,5-alpha-L-arabinosidase
MKSHVLAAAFLFAAAVSSNAQPALNGEPFIHDPSTIGISGGKYFTFGTGSGGLMSDDGWTWRSGAVRPGGGVAPDIIKIGDRYWVSYSVGAGGHASNVHTMWTKSLDPNSPDFKFNDDTIIFGSDGVEDNDAIDPAFLLDPAGRLWLSYGTYFGNIRVIEISPKTGKLLPTSRAVNVAIDMEATAMIYRDGWYYLLGTHGTCCDGANSTYNIRVGRSRRVTGPYVDNMGQDLMKGGGKLVAAASGRFVGLGHFGRLVLGDGVEKFSCHYEADLDRSGRSVLDIRPLLWKNGWPVGGDNFAGGNFEIQSERSGGALELGVDFVRMAGRGGGFGGLGAGAGRGGAPGAAPAGAPGAAGRGAAGAPGAAPAGAPAGGGRGAGAPGAAPAAAAPVAQVPAQQLSEVLPGWPAGSIDLRIGDYMGRPHQLWTISPAPNAGGYPGAPYFKIVITGTDRALAAAAGNEVVTVAAFTGAPEQLWRIDQLTDGTYRIMPKSVPGSQEPAVLTAAAASTPTLAKFDPKSDKSRWTFRKP